MRSKPKTKNALAHGLYANDLVLPWENEQDFVDLYHGIRRQLRPDGTLQDEVVLDIAQLHWRKRRVHIGMQLAYRGHPDADAMAKWLPPYGFTCKVHHLEAKVGGTFRMSFTNFTTNSGHSFGGEYLEIVPNERIRYTDRFDDPNLPGVIEVTVTLKAVSIGTEINIEQTNLPTVIPVEACYLGWQQSLAQLASLVEPDIPG